MKAAVINKFGDIPRYEDFPDPVLNDGDVEVKVEAVILDYANKVIASGTHFASQQFFPSFPAVVGYSGIGSLEDGSLVSFRGMKPPYGSMAEKVVVPKAFATPIPEGVTAEQAAVIPSAALSSLGPLRYAAKLQLGETVLINGATSVSGMLAVQIAKYLGAGREIQLSAETLLTSGLEIYGMGAQSSPEALAECTKQIWDIIKQGKLTMDIVKIPLKDIEKAWELEEHGKRIVIVP